MTTTTDEFREDAQFLREVTDKNVIAKDIRERLFRIADNVEMMANAMFTPSLQLEKQAEEWLTDLVKEILGGITSPDHPTRPIVLALWLIQRQLANAGTKSLFGQGLSAVGLGAIAKAFVDNTGDVRSTTSTADTPEAEGQGDGNHA